MKFVFDLDGTICFKGIPVSEVILTRLERLTQTGHEVLFASARPVRDMLPVLHQRFHHYTLIGGNGSLIFKDGKSIYTHAFSPEQRNFLLQLLEDHQVTYLIDSDWDYAYTGSEHHPIKANIDLLKLATIRSVSDLSQIVKILILTAHDEDQLFQKLNALDVVIHHHTYTHEIDISPSGIHKWSALQWLGVEEGNFIAFGNDVNDISMFQMAQHAVMVGHHDRLAPYASVSISSDEDSIISHIDYIVNNMK
ncbi:pyridoxal phosphate (PLP) phosphatase [compost metagenome]